MNSPHAPDDPGREEWDVAVIGTGMGGATVGYALARRGRRVLFLEKGRFLQQERGIERGELADAGEDPDVRLRRGLWPLPIQGATSHGGRLRRSLWPLPFEGTSNAGDFEFFAPLGCGTGGSTILYGAALERFHPSDFRPRANFPEASEATLPDAWPITYDELAPYYRQAEELFRVRGTQDPLHPDHSGALLEAPPLSERDQDIHDLFLRRGMHPYRVHVGFEFVEGCGGCGGILCLRACKSDSGRICLLPALESFGAKLLTQCEVTRLEADRSKVSRITCSWRGGEISIAARMVVLAAGALMSPVLLLNSRDEHWAQGLANGSGLVGRNLMVHTSDMIAVHPDRGGSTVGPAKSLSLNDLYLSDGWKLGNLQSVGVPVSTGAVLGHLRSVLSKRPKWWRKLARPLLLRVIARIGAFYFRNAVMFWSIIEDLPYYENRVLPDPRAKNGMRFEYRYHEELAERNALFRRRLVERLGRRRVVCLTRDINLNFGHPCGTCRIGDDPETSVLDRNNRSHEVENLYVVDASFFPSSGGTNPSLTIAANALRVAEAIDRQLA